MLDPVSAIPLGAIPAGTTKHHYGNSSLADALLRTAYKDRDAFRLVCSLTSSALFKVCFRVCRDRSAAEDVLADVYITIWKRAGTWTPERGSTIVWLSRIARNRAIDRQRARARRGIEVDDDACHVPDGAPDAEALLLKAETEMRVRRSLGALTFEQQSAIRAAFFDGHTYAELAARRGVPLGTMKSWVRRGLMQMRNELQLADDGRACAAPTVQIHQEQRQLTPRSVAYDHSL